MHAGWDAMATSGVAAIACMVALVMAAAVAEAQRSENVNYRSPVMGGSFPHLARSGALIQP